MRLGPGNLYFDLLLGLGLRSGGAVSGFALSWMMARIYGAETVGLYQIGLTTAMLVSLLVSFGLEILLVREAGPMLRDGNEADAKALFRRSLTHMLRAGIAFGFLVVACAFPLSQYLLGEPRAFLFIVVMAPVVLSQPLLKLLGALLRTHGDIVLSQSLEGIFYTTFAMLVLALAWAMGATHWELLPAAAYVAGYLLALIVGGIVVRRIFSAWPEGGEAQIDLAAGARIVTAPFVTQGGNWLVLLIIAGAGTLAQAGIYRIVFLICQLYQLINASFATMTGPHLSRAAAASNLREVRRIVRSAGLIGLGLSLPLTVICLAAPEWVLGLFGPQFVDGVVALMILVISQLINVGVGPAGTALIMLRREKVVLVLEILATGSSVIIALVTFEQLGLVGPALGVLAASIMRNFGSLGFLLSMPKGA